MRSSISAQSWESVPPAPAWTRDDGVAGVVLAAEEARLFELGEAPLDRGQLGRQLRRHLLVLGGHLRQLVEVGDLGLELAEALQLALGARVLRRRSRAAASWSSQKPGRCISASRRSTSASSEAGSKVVREQVQLLADRRPGARDTDSFGAASAMPQGSQLDGYAVALMIQVEAGRDDPVGPSNSASTSRISAAIFGRISSTRSPQSRSTSAAGPMRHVELDRVVEVVADLHRQVAAAQGRSPRSRRSSSCSLTVSALAIENGPGPQVGSSVSSGCSRYSLDDLLGAVDPLVVELAPPDDRDEPAARDQRRVDVAQRLHRVGEEHQAHAREGVVEGPAEVADLHVGDREVDVLRARLFGLLRAQPR